MRWFCLMVQAIACFGSNTCAENERCGMLSGPGRWVHSFARPLRRVVDGETQDFIPRINESSVNWSARLHFKERQRGDYPTRICRAVVAERLAGTAGRAKPF